LQSNIISSNTKITLQDKAVFNVVFKEYYATLVLFSNNYTYRNQEASEDIVQDVFVKLLNDKREFQNLLVLKSYLYTSVKNACLNYLKHLKVKNIYKTEEEASFNKEGFFLDNVLEEEVFIHLNNAIHQLPEKCRQVFELSLKGIKNKEIATQMGISIETVKSQKKRGKVLLKKLLKNNIYIFFILLSVI